MNSGRVDLLDHARVIAQLCSLERRVARGGRNSIDHLAGAHDDVANAIAGLVVISGSAIDHTISIGFAVPTTRIGMSPHAISVGEKREYASADAPYVSSGGGTRPPWAY